LKVAAATKPANRRTKKVWRYEYFMENWGIKLTRQKEPAADPRAREAQGMFIVKNG